uniref:DUF8018 domain-containing protein n=1 Tax=Solanum lycopersicum TaxID=4081 RepID=A0A3Q7FNA2_SOLLC
MNPPNIETDPFQEAWIGDVEDTLVEWKVTFFTLGHHDQNEILGPWSPKKVRTPTFPIPKQLGTTTRKSCYGVSKTEFIPLPGPSGQASGAEFEEDHFGIDVLLESWEKSTETGMLVDQPEPEPGHVPPAIQVSVQSIQRRLLAKYSYTPPIGIMYLTEIEAKDLFEVKVEILRIMAVFDQMEDWMGRGARALVHLDYRPMDNSFLLGKEEVSIPLLLFLDRSLTLDEEKDFSPEYEI